MAIDLSELTYDEDFCTAFIIESHHTTWSKGDPVITSSTTTVTGIVAPSSPKDLELVEEGDRRHGTKTFYTNMQQMRVTNVDTTSDMIIWNGQKYKLLHVWNYSANGYWKAVGELMGDDASG